MIEQLLQRLARLKRGDTWRRLLALLRSLRPGGPEAYPRVGPLRDSHRALLLDQADHHLLREESLQSLIRVLSDVPIHVRPPVPRSPWVIHYFQRDSADILRKLHELPAHWEVPETLDERVVPHFATGASSPISDPALEVEFTPVRGQEHSFHPARDWSARIASWLRPPFPIDIVYTWVDGTDPAWQERRDSAMSEARKSTVLMPSAHQNSTDAARYVSSDELRYSLRSVYQYANWVRHIYIVTDAQTPEWLLSSHSKISVVDHREILPHSSFNSHAIESALHRIPGLSEHYLYLNDDVFFGRMSYPSDYFDERGRAKFFPSDLTIPEGPALQTDKPIIAAAKNGRDVMKKRFGREITQRIRHSVHAQRRGVVEQMEIDLADDFARLETTPFRSPRDLSVASALHHWYGAELDMTVPGETDYLYRNITDRGTGQILDALASLKRYDVFCLNEEESNPRTEQARHELEVFLEQYFPLPAPWEI